jgi:hypothetical protein
MVVAQQLSNLSTGSTIHISRAGITSSSAFGVIRIPQQTLKRNPRSKAGGGPKSLIFRLSKLSHLRVRTIATDDCNATAVPVAQLFARYGERIGMLGIIGNPRQSLMRL